jgi:oligopeptide transport system substrate-binding protein
MRSRIFHRLFSVRPGGTRVALILLLLGLGSGCARRETPAEAGRQNGTLLLGNGAEPEDLDPAICTALSDYNVLIALFEGLTCIDEATSAAVPGAASSWDVSPDGLRYTFHLRPGLVWSNGEALTADDFVFSFQRSLSPKLGSDNSYLFYPVLNAEAFNAGKITDFSQVGIKARDPLTLEITLKAPCPYLPSLAAHQVWFPVPRSVVLKYGAMDQRGTGWTKPGHLIGNGPYTLRQWSPNDRIVVEQNPRYWDAGRNTLSQVVFFPNEDIAVDENNFRAGQLHLTWDLLPDRIAHYRQTAPEVLRVDPLSESFFLRFNVNKPPLNDPRVRQALARAIDREAIARDILQGSQRPAYALTPPDTAGYTPSARIPTDYAAARQLLAAAGYPGGKGFPHLEVQLNSDAINAKILEAVQQMWHRELGVDVTLANEDFRVWLDNLRTGSYQISRSRWIADYNDPSTYLDIFKSNSGSNWTGWSNREYDRLNDEATRTLDLPRRYDLLRQAEAILLADGPIAPIFFGSRTYLIQPYVTGWVPSLLGIHRYQYVGLKR